MHRSSLSFLFPADEFIEKYKEPQDLMILSRPLIILVVNYCASITSYVDTLDAMEEHLVTSIIDPELTLECMYLCCFMNNLEYFKSLYKGHESNKSKKQLNILKQWHPVIFMLVSGLLEEQFYIIETFLQDIGSDYSNFNKLIFDMELADSTSKEKLAFLYVHNEKNYALGLTASSEIVAQAFRFFHQERNTFMQKNNTKWAFLDKVNLSRKFWTYTCPLGLKFYFSSLESIEPTLAAHIRKMDKVKHFNLFEEQYNLRNTFEN